MRFLHTGDWHIGKELRGRQRYDECGAALGQVLDVARRERIDCLLVAGDVYDSQAPPPEAERLVFDFFRELYGAGIPAVVVAGNHDHPKRLSALGRVLDLVGIHLRGDAVPADAGGLIELPSRDGKETAVIAALPWVPERKVIELHQYMEGTAFSAYADEVALMMESLAGGFRANAVNLVVAHLMLDGAVVGPGGGERPLHLGQTYAINAQRLPAAAQYVALGHIHRPQEIVAPTRARYAGSLLQLDFGETDQRKSVVLIEAHPRLPATVQEIEVSAGRPLRDVRGTLDELRRQAAELADAYLRVTVETQGPTTGISQQVQEFLPNALEVKEDYPRRPASPEPEFRHLRPEELFASYYRTAHGLDPRPELRSLFRRLLEEQSASA